MHFLAYFSIFTLFLLPVKATNLSLISPINLNRAVRHVPGPTTSLNLLPENYSIHSTPEDDGPTTVNFSVLVFNVRDVNEIKEELSLEINYRIYWKDKRLTNVAADLDPDEFFVLNPAILSEIWHPDIFIDHVIKVEQPLIVSKPESLRMYLDGSLRYSARLTLTMACHMHFHYYPADTQICDVDLKSYAYSSDYLILNWKEGKGAVFINDDSDNQMPNYDVSLAKTATNFYINSGSGIYSGIYFRVVLRRKISYHVIQTYIPSALFIMISWLSFLVPPVNGDRMTLCMTTLLTLTAMFTAVSYTTPNVSYVKAIDIWMVACIIFVLFTLLEYTIVLKLQSMKGKASKPGNSKDCDIPLESQNLVKWNVPSSSDPIKALCKNIEFVIKTSGSGTTIEIKRDNDPDQTVDDGPLEECKLEYNEKHGNGGNGYEKLIQRMEQITPFLALCLFTCFNFIYWPWLLYESENNAVKARM